MSYHLQNRKPTYKPKKNRGEYQYTDNFKINAVKLYLMTGNALQTATALGITHKTLMNWRNSSWWPKIVDDIRSEGRIQLSKKLKDIVTTALDITMDRLQKGDFMYDHHSGDMIRRPVSAKDAHRIASDLIDKSEKLQDPVNTPTTAVEDRLTQLADAFRSFASKTTKVEVLDAVYVERQEGLQEGKILGTETSGTEASESRENGSPENRGEEGSSPQGGHETGGPHNSPESWRVQLSGELEGSPQT